MPKDYLKKCLRNNEYLKPVENPVNNCENSHETPLFDGVENNENANQFKNF